MSFFSDSLLVLFGEPDIDDLVTLTKAICLRYMEVIKDERELNSVPPELVDVVDRDRDVGIPVKVLALIEGPGVPDGVPEGLT